MSDRFSLISTNQYLEISKQWDSLLAMGESVCVIFPYLSDRQFRLKQYSDSLKDKNLISIDISSTLILIDDIDELKNFINQQLPETLRKENLEKSLLGQNINIVLVIVEGEALLKPKYEFLLGVLQNISLSFSNIRVLISFEASPFKIVPDFSKYNLLFQNIVYYPLYSDSNIMAFIEHLCKKWNLKMPQPIRKSITYNSGGFFWLTKEACRIYRNTSVWSPSAPGFQFRLSAIAKSLSLEEKDILISCPQLKGFEHSEDLKHLKKIALVREDNTISVPTLVDVINKHKEKIKVFHLDEGEITLRGFSLSKVLSATEYSLLKYFFSKPNITVTRDEISTILWPEDPEENYSQWAIDQAIKRLRDRLVSLKLPPTIIKSIRGLGYEFRE